MFQKCHASLLAGGFTTRESQARLLGHASEVVAQGNRFLRSSKHMKRSKNKALIYWTIYLSVCLSVCLSVDPSIHPSIDLSIYLSIHPSIHLSIYLCVCMCMCMCTSICMCICKIMQMHMYLLSFLPNHQPLPVFQSIKSVACDRKCT